MLETLDLLLTTTQPTKNAKNCFHSKHTLYVSFHIIHERAVRGDTRTL